MRNNSNLTKEEKRSLTIFKKHNTKEGRILTLANMSNKHLLNTINLLLEPMISIIDASNLEFDEDNKYLAHAYDIPSLNPYEVSSMLIDTMLNVQPYLIEAYLRGLHEPIEQLNIILKRGKQALLKDVITID